MLSETERWNSQLIQFIPSIMSNRRSIYRRRPCPFYDTFCVDGFLFFGFLDPPPLFPLIFASFIEGKKYATFS